MLSVKSLLKVIAIFLFISSTSCLHASQPVKLTFAKRTRTANVFQEVFRCSPFVRLLVEDVPKDFGRIKLKTYATRDENLSKVICFSVYGILPDKEEIELVHKLYRVIINPQEKLIDLIPELNIKNPEVICLFAEEQKRSFGF